MSRVLLILGLTAFLATGAQAQTTASAPAPPTKVPPRESPETPVVAVGDIADCNSPGDEQTAALVDGLPGTVAVIGDVVYESGSAEEFASCYHPTWGRFRPRTRPAVGNHEYITPGAAGYFAYFGAAAGDPQRGWYSFNLGPWHVIVLNSNCWEIGGCHAGSPQETWLRADLAANPSLCTLAYWHHPRFSSGAIQGDPGYQPFWQALYEAGADLNLVGHAHNYQRWTPLDPAGNPDPDQGIRQFVVGTGGRGLHPVTPQLPGQEVINDTTWGVLTLMLSRGAYYWRFVPVAGRTFTDSGSTACH
jgi:hypothetical protein